MTVCGNRYATDYGVSICTQAVETHDPDWHRGMGTVHPRVSPGSVLIRWPVSPQQPQQPPPTQEELGRELLRLLDKYEPYNTAIYHDDAEAVDHYVRRLINWYFGLDDDE